MCAGYADNNKDDKISYVEHLNNIAKIARNLDNYNQDGDVVKEARKHADKDESEHRAEFEDMDENDDGFVNIAEYQAHHSVQKAGRNWHTEADTDGNG